MSQEKPIIRKKLLPEGWREFTIISCEPSVSKGGNEMFIFELQDSETGYIDKLYAVSTQGKRWLLKTILTACGVPAGQDGVYDWETSAVIGKQVQGLVEHEDNEWINREGETVKSKKHKIVEIKEPEEIAWDDEKK
jgi:DNA-binding PadR family transcriptional regulator